MTTPITNWDEGSASHPLVVPLDGSEEAERALHYAGLLPNRWLRLVAVEPIELTAARMRWALDQVPPNGGTWLVETPSAYLELVAWDLREQGREIEIVVTRGEPGPSIVEVSADAAMIVMTTHSNRLATNLLGGTADYVMGHTTVPTLLVRDKQPEAQAILRLVVPLDGSEHAAEALPLAATLGRESGAALYLIRVVDPSASLATTSQLVQEATSYLKTLGSRFEDRARRITYDVRTGSPEHELLEGLIPGDLIVMTTRSSARLGRLGRLLGSVPKLVLDQSPVPVMLVRVPPGRSVSAYRRSVEQVSILRSEARRWR